MVFCWFLFTLFLSRCQRSLSIEDCYNVHVLRRFFFQMPLSAFVRLAPIAGNGSRTYTADISMPYIDRKLQIPQPHIVFQRFGTVETIKHKPHCKHHLLKLKRRKRKTGNHHQHHHHHHHLQPCVELGGPSSLVATPFSYYNLFFSDRHSVHRLLPVRSFVLIKSSSPSMV